MNDSLREKIENVIELNAEPMRKPAIEISKDILSLIRTACEEVTKGMKDTTETIGTTDKALKDVYNKALSAYHNALMKKLK